MTDAAEVHPFDKILTWLHPLDFVVLGHGWADHGRDYLLGIEDMLGRDPGTHEILLTHCVQLEYATRVRDDVWPRSWDDVFTDYARWEAAGHPDGYVWGTGWSMAYPGLAVVRDSELAREWSRRVDHRMFEVTLETDRFFLRAIFHSASSRKVSDDVEVVNRLIIPLPRD